MSIRCYGAALVKPCRGPQPAVDESWACRGGPHEFSLGVSGPDRLFVWQRLALLVRGLAVRGDSRWDPEYLAEEVRAYYLDHGTLPPDLAGGFTLFLLDADTCRVLLHRNPGGVAPLWYHAGPEGLRFGSNLPELLDALGQSPSPATAVLAEYVHAGRLPPGASLFAGIGRLQPGETLTWTASGLGRFAVTTPRLAELPTDSDPDSRRVLSDHAARSPGAVTLLGGDAGTRRLQALWSDLIRSPGLPATFSVARDAPHAWGEIDEALRAAHDLGTRHTLVPADAFADALCSTLAATGEPPPDERTPTFVRLGAVLARQGVTAVLSGDGSEPFLGSGGVGLLARLGLLGPGQDATAAVEQAGLRSVLLQEAGVDLVCPYLDSRLQRRAVRCTSSDPAPPAAWLAPGGCLRSFVETLGDYPGIDPKHLSGPALYRLVCCDLWRKHFIPAARAQPTDRPATGIPARAARAGLAP